jgi:hypothetical protein
MGSLDAPRANVKDFVDDDFQHDDFWTTIS